MAVTLTLAKSHLRVDGDAEDTLIGTYLAAAQAWVENVTGKKLVRGSVTQSNSAFGLCVPLFWGPNPDDVTIRYLDSDGAEATVTNGQLAMGRVYAPAGGWPSVYPSGSIEVSYTAGYETTPADLDNAVLLLVGEFYQNREAGAASGLLMSAVTALCGPHRDVRV